jgi:hypothetical protein
MGRMQIPTLSRWRAFASARYRPFQAIAIGQAFTGSYASDALFVPVLLRLGAPPALVIVVGSFPVAGSILQALAPQILRRMAGNLRRLTLLLTLAEMRGFLHAAVIAGIAAGAISAPVGVVLVSVVVAVCQTAGVLSASNINLWTAVVLPDQERRLVGPRMGAMNMALSTLLLLPAGAVLDAGLRSIGLWVYAGFFAVGGLASILTPLAVAKLPYPGRVLVKTGDEPAEALPEEFKRFTTATAVASMGQGLIPYLSLYAIHVLGASPGFAVILSGSASAGALAGSLTTGTFLLRGSSSRVLRVSFLARSVAAVICGLAIPGNPAALPMLVLGSVLFNGAGNAGALASNERLYRLAPPDLRVRCQSYYMAATSASFAVGALACGVALAVSESLGWPTYTALFVGSGISRAVAGLRTDVSPTWRSPTAPPTDQI